MIADLMLKGMLASRAATVKKRQRLFGTTSFSTAQPSLVDGLPPARK